MTVVVTGATGFVGSSVVRSLLKRGETVRVMARAGSDRRNLEGLDIEVVEADLLDPPSLSTLVAGARGLYHLAADYRLWSRRPDEIYQANLEGTRNLLRAAANAGVERIVYTSSVATLGIHRDGTPADEETPSNLKDMIGHYKRSKFLAEEAVNELIAEAGLPIVIVNPSTPIGPRDVKPTPTGRMIVEAAAGRMPAFVDTGLNVVHVDDVAEGHLLAYDIGQIGERYILGGTNMTLAEILEGIAQLTGGKAPRVKLPHSVVMPIAAASEAWSRLRPNGTPFVTIEGVRMARKRMFFSSAKAISDLGYRFRPWEEALADSIEWFRRGGYLQ
ncbi:MAG: NAD-dependent epimerase/dehydratase family protein [Kiloniellales bacterium]|nr:NAD-dependent epimerase/dehydratase family protein [Kiloniellales bacterium]